MSFLQFRSPFNDANSVPTVYTLDATDVASTSVTGNGILWSSGGPTVTELGFCWSTSPDPTTADSTVTTTVVGGAYSATISPLIASTTYHYRAYAINQKGTAYGQDFTFTTLTSANIMNMCLMGVG